jgi:hypothetical protein
MFKINTDKSIYLTRGDIATINVSANNPDGTAHEFQEGDTVRIKVYEKKDCSRVVLQKDTSVPKATNIVSIYLGQAETKIGVLTNKPVDYWYEVELNPITAPQTIIGYDEDGAKIFRLFPEGSDLSD